QRRQQRQQQQYYDDQYYQEQASQYPQAQQATQQVEGTSSGQTIKKRVIREYDADGNVVSEKEVSE
ncbi:MAG TPA: hypothetical protein PLV52_05875, partial [Candidatus Omnitrophota bacterium]|nr:hypothetical protein [Candidatus Omnitrophota bacterium]